MLPDNIYEICKTLGLDKQDIEKISTCNKIDSNPINNQNISADLYKAGTRYGSVCIDEFLH